MKNNDLLLVIDMQNVYMPGGEWCCPSMPAAVSNTKKLIDSGTVGTVLFTKYIAPEDPVGRWAEYNSEYRAVNEDEFQCDMIDEFKPYLTDENLVIKSTYSSLTVEEIREAVLRADHVLLSGVVSECCVLATLMQAIDLGAHVVYLTDCVSGQSDENEAMVRRIAELFSPMHCIVTDSAGYLAMLSDGRL